MSTLSKCGYYFRFGLLLIFLIAAALFAIGLFTISVSGTVTLPNGLIAEISGPFSSVGNDSLATIETGNRKFVFTKSAMTVDGWALATFDDTVKKIALATSWNHTRLFINGNEVELPKKQ